MKTFTLRSIISLAALQIAATNAFSLARSSSDSTSSSNNDTSSSSDDAAAQQNLTSLTYPSCTANAAATWCGIVVALVANISTASLTYYNVSITDSSCNLVLRKDNILPNSTANLSTSVGDWAFSYYNDKGGLDLSYNGVDIVNETITGDNGALELFNITGGVITEVVYGAWGNCTPADKADKSKSEGGLGVREKLPGVLGMMGLGAVSVLFLGLL